MKQRPFCDQRTSMKSNPILVRTKIGKVTDTTRDLPPQEYRYGYQSHDDHGVAECMKWGDNDDFTGYVRKRSASVRKEKKISKQEIYNQSNSSGDEFSHAVSAKRQIEKSGSIRKNYDGYDPRNPDRFGFDKSLCPSKVDPHIIYGTSAPSTSATSNKSDQLSNFDTSSKNPLASARRVAPSYVNQSPLSYRVATGVEAITSPTRVKQPTVRKQRGKQDFVETNRQALKAGCVTASEFRDFKENHDIFVKPEENFQTQEDEYLRYRQKQMVHGIPTPVSTEMKECLTWQGYRDAKAKALQKREIQKERKARKAAKQPKGIRQTRASRGQSHKPDPPPSYADTFKIKRFAEIDHYAIKDYWD